MTEKREKEIEDIVLKEISYGNTPVGGKQKEECAKRIATHISKEYVRRDEVGIDADKLKVFLWNYIDGTPANSLNNETFTLGWSYTEHIAKAVEASSKDVLAFGEGENNE